MGAKGALIVAKMLCDCAKRYCAISVGLMSRSAIPYSIYVVVKRSGGVTISAASSPWTDKRSACRYSL